MLRGSRGDAAGTELGSSFVERIDSEHGNRPGPARPRASGAVVGLGASSADRVGTGRSRRSTPRPGEPVTWGRAAAVSRREGGCNAERCTGEWWCPAGGPVRVAAAGIGDAGQASPLGGGRSWPPVRRPVQPRARPGDADRGVRPGRGQPRGEHTGRGRPDGRRRRGVHRGARVPGRPAATAEGGHVPSSAGAGTQDPQAGRVGKGPQPRDSRRWPTGSSRRR